MSFATVLQGISPFGPIFGKELRVTARRKRTYWLRFLYLGLLLLVLLAAYAGNEGFRHDGGGIAAQNQRLSQLGQLFFGCFAVFSVVAMGFLGPILTSTAIGSERLQKTLPVLLMTPITAWQIVAGKLFSRMLVSLTLIALGLPVLALVRLLGGVELEQMVGAIALALVAALSSAAIGLFFSTLLNRAYAVILLSYAVMLALYWFVPMVISMIVAIGGFGPRRSMGMLELLLAFNPYAMVFGVAVPNAWGRLPIAMPWIACIGSHLVLTAVLLVCSAMILRRRERHSGEKASRPAPAFVAGRIATPVGPPPLPGFPPTIPAPVEIRRKPAESRTVADNPILWRELRRPLMARRWQAITGGVICAAAIIIVYCIQAYGKQFSDPDWQIGYATVFNFLFSMLILVIASTSIAQEKESDTWTLLLTTPVSGGTIVWGKTVGIMRRMIWPIVLILLHFLLFWGVGAIKLGTCLLVIWIMLTFNSVWVATGMYLSLRIRKVTAAVVLNLGLALALYAAVPTVLAIIGNLTEIRKMPEQTLWYLPYYYIGNSIDGMRPENGWRDPDRTIEFDPIGEHVSKGVFVIIVLFIGLSYLGIAGLILMHTSYHFDTIVGRARQKKGML